MLEWTRGVEIGLRPIDGGDLTGLCRDAGRMREPNEAVERPRLTREAERLVVHVMGRRAARVYVRPRANPSRPFAEGGDEQRELRHQSQRGGNSPEEWALRVGDPGAGHHLSLEQRQARR